MTARAVPVRVSSWRRYLHLNYRSFTRTRGWLTRRLTPAGGLVFWLLVVAGALGVDTTRAMAFQAFGALACALGVAWIWSLASRARFTVERRLPRSASAGSPMPYELTVRNLSRRAQRAVHLTERATDTEPTLEAFATTPEPGERRRNWVDRRLLFYRWEWLWRRERRVVPEPVRLPDLPPGGTATVAATLTPLRRGRLELAGALLTWPEPLGLFRSVAHVSAPGAVLVLPRRYPLSRIALPGTARLQPGGVALAGSVGESEEFVALRDYRPGDALRRIHWPAWARTGQPIVREFQDEFFVRHALLLDTSAGPAAADRFEEAVAVAASFACTVDEGESLLDLMFVGPRAFVFTAGRGVAHSRQLLEVLAAVQLSGEGTLADLERLVTAHLPVLSGCVCVLLAWDEPRRRLVERIRSTGVPVLVLVVAESPTTPPHDAPGFLHWLEPGRVAEGLAALR